MSLQRFSTWNNNQGTLFINAEITGNALYFHSCSSETIFFGVGHAAIISFASLTHTEGDTILFQASVICLEDFSVVGQGGCRFGSFYLKIFQHFHQGLCISRYSHTTLMPYPGMQRHHLCQVQKTSLQLATNQPSH